MDFKTLSIENKNDVENAINTLLLFTELEDRLNPVNCSYNFITNLVVFELQLAPTFGKKDFFASVKVFEDFIDVE